MSDITADREFATAPIIDLKDLLPYAVLMVFVATLALYFVGAEEGATAMFPGATLHEWVHDARHLLGFPCH